VPDDPGALFRDAPITHADPATRTLTVQLLAWDQPRVVTDPGRPPYRESWGPGSLVPLDHLYVVDRHHGDLIGRMDPPYDSGTGPVSQVHIAHTRAGDDLLALVDADVVRSVSIEALRDPASDQWSPDHQAVHRTRGYLAGLAFAFHAAHDSPILARSYGGSPMPVPTSPPPAVPAPAAGPAANGAAPDADPLDALMRSLEALAPPPPGGNAGQPTTGTGAGQAPTPPGTPAPAPAAPAAPAGPFTPWPPTAPAPAPAGPAAVADPADRIAAALTAAADARSAQSVDALQHQLVVMRSAMLTLVDHTRKARPGGSRYHSWGEVMRANAAGQLDATDQAWLARALVDITTADIPGLIPQPVLAQIFQNIVQNQQLVAAAGTAPFPDSGMSVDYPQVTARPAVGVQDPEKTEVVSVKTHVARQSQPVYTLAGGEDISVQAILRSSPSYLELVGQLYLEAMATATDLLAWWVYRTAVDPQAAHMVSIGVDPKAWVGKLFAAAGQVLVEYKALPTAMVISTDLWVKFGSAVDADGRPLFSARNPMNNMGTASLTSTDGTVVDLSWSVDPNLPADTGCLFAPAAFRACLGGVSTITADVPARLGRDYAVYRFGTFLPVDPTGLILFFTGATPPPIPTPAAGQALTAAEAAPAGKTAKS